MQSPLERGGNLVDVVNNSQDSVLVESGDHALGMLTGDGQALQAESRLAVNEIRQNSLSLERDSRFAIRTGPNGKLSMVVNTLSIAGNRAPTAALDLNSGSAIVDYIGTSPVDTIRQQIIAGRGGPGLGKGWNGPGITR